MSALEEWALDLVERECERLGWLVGDSDDLAVRFGTRREAPIVDVRYYGKSAGPDAPIPVLLKREIDPLTAVLWLALAQLGETVRVGPCPACEGRRPPEPRGFEHAETAERVAWERMSHQQWWCPSDDLPGGRAWGRAGLQRGARLVHLRHPDHVERERTNGRGRPYAYRLRCPTCSGSGDDERDLGRLVCEAAPRPCAFKLLGRESCPGDCPNCGGRQVEIGNPVAREHLTVVADRMQAEGRVWELRASVARFQTRSDARAWAAANEGWTVDNCHRAEDGDRPWRLRRLRDFGRWVLPVPGLPLGELLALWLTGAPCPGCEGDGTVDEMVTNLGSEEWHPVDCPACAGHRTAYAAKLREVITRTPRHTRRMGADARL